MGHSLLYRLADRFIARQESTFRHIEKTLPSPAAELAVREHLRAIESTLDKIDHDGADIRLERLGRVCA